MKYSFITIISLFGGWSFAENTAKGRTQVQLTVDQLYARNKLRRVFGYVAEIQLPPEAKGSVPLDPSVPFPPVKIGNLSVN